MFRNKNGALILFAQYWRQAFICILCIYKQAEAKLRSNIWELILVPACLKYEKKTFSKILQMQIQGGHFPHKLNGLINQGVDIWRGQNRVREA